MSDATFEIPQAQEELTLYASVKKYKILTLCRLRVVGHNVLSSFIPEKKNWNMYVRGNIEILYVILNTLNLAHVKSVNDVSTHTFFL